MHAGAVLHHADDLAFGFLGVIAQEFGAADFIQHGEPLRLAGGFAGTGPAGAGFGALLFHGEGKAVLIHRDAAGAQRILGEVEGKAVSVVKLEGDIAGQAVACFHAGGGFVQELEAARQGFAEADFLQLQGFLDQAFGALEFGIGGAHFRHQGRHQPVHQRILGAQQMRMAHAAAHDAAKDIAAAFIGGQHAIGDQERSRAQMVGDDPVAEHRLALGGDAGSFDRSGDDVAEQVHIVIVGDALHDGGDALQPHAGVDRGLGQVEAGVGVHLLELHEDQVPEFQETVAIFVRAAGRAARNLVALVVENLRADSRKGPPGPSPRDCSDGR